MASQGQEYSRYQRGVIQRYYEHADTIALQKLSEIVSDLYLAEGSKATALWNSARKALEKLAAPNDPHVMKVLSVRSVTGLAKLVNDLSAAAKASSRDTQSKTALDAVIGEPPPSEAKSIVGQNAASPATPSDAPQGAPLQASASAASASSAASAPPTPEQLRHALKAFRKRLKLTRLDEESKLGRTGNAMSGGKKSAIVAIMPPREYPQAVWDELVRQGRLRRSGSFYELAE